MWTQVFIEIRRRMLKKKNHAGNAPAILPLICAVAALTAFGAGDLMAQARQGSNQDPLFLTATNGTANFLAIVDTRTKQVTFVSTGGAGGASGNAGGVAVEGKLAAVVNFGSTNVTIFVRHGNTMESTQ